MKKTLFAAIAVTLLALACTPKTGKKISTTDPKPEDQPTTINLPELQIIASQDSMPDLPNELPVYQASARREHDLIHEKVELSFDWPNARAAGKATLTLRPYFYQTDSLTLDAKNFEVKNVHFDGQNAPLKYRYDGMKLVVNLGKNFTRKDEYKIVIEYVARPNERDSFGGSAAINSDKGLYFINNDGKDAEKPMQIWTQGETESNSRWMPTIDKPNERTTGEVILTVDKKFETLSNGLLISQKDNPDGSRTDHWKMDLPHAPYLFMIAVGDFAVVKDKWRDKGLAYFVEPKYEKDATAIFPYTPELLTFFSEKLDYPYPWQSFSQVVVRDYVSGAMENTGAVIFGEYVQATTRELLDANYTNEKVVAHEMFHHWFGDLVTCESWSNLTLNEGFANYSEYLWMEHKHGREAADEHLQNERFGYYGSAQDGGHDLIDFHYVDKENMFDGHSYNKGGAVLHMLRKYLGDEAFFGALNFYLKKHEFTAVEADELRMAFEDFIGEDLNWFWDQWFFDKGWPNINVNWDFDEISKKVTLKLAQTQDPNSMRPIFTLPTTVEIWQADGSKKVFPIKFEKRNQTFVFDAPARPELVEIDPERILLATFEYEKTDAEMDFQYRHSSSFEARNDALNQFSEMTGAPRGKALAKLALDDKSATNRTWAVAGCDVSDPVLVEKLIKMAEFDPNPGVRVAATGRLGEAEGKKHSALFSRLLGENQPYSVVAAALSELVKADPAAAAEAAKTLEADQNAGIQTALLELYASTGDASKLPFFVKQLETVDGPATFTFFDSYPVFLKRIGNLAAQTSFFEKCHQYALDQKQSQWRRFGATKAIADERNALTEAGKTTEAAAFNKWLDEIKTAEKDETLLMYYQMF